MQRNTTAPHTVLVTACAVLVLSACGASDTLAPDDAGSGALQGGMAGMVATDPGPSAVEYKLSSFDFQTLTLTATNKLGWTVIASLTPETSFSEARVDRFIPTDPCRAWAVEYNLPDTESNISAIEELAALQCNVRLIVNAHSSTVRQFQPVP